MAAPKKYPDELRERAVRLLRDSQRPIAHVAWERGVHPEALRKWIRQDEGNWIRQDDADRARRDDRLATVEREELARLREVVELRRANEILREATRPDRRGRETSAQDQPRPRQESSPAPPARPPTRAPGRSPRRRCPGASGHRARVDPSQPSLRRQPRSVREMSQRCQQLHRHQLTFRHRSATCIGPYRA